MLYGGAAGGGKSEYIAGEAFTQAIETPENQILILRREYVELERSLIRRTQQIYPLEVSQYNASKHTWTIQTSGKPSLIEFGHCHAETDVMRYKSAEYGAIFIDQAEEWTEWMLRFLVSRLRSSNPKVWPRLRLCANPGGVGHGMLKRLFRTNEPALYGKVWAPPASRDETRPPTRCFIPARVCDNPALLTANPQYLDNLRQLPPNERAMMLDGSWDVFSGQAFGEWNADLHTVPAFEVPKHWRRRISWDFGYAKPASVHLYASSPEGRVYAIDELYGSGMTAHHQAQLVCERFLCRFDSAERRCVKKADCEAVIYDPAMNARPGETGKSIVETLQEVFKQYGITGINWLPAKNDRLSGKHQVHSYLRIAPDGKPWFQAFRETCPNLIRTMPELVTDKLHPEDVDTECEDHAYDDLRYEVMSRVKPSNSTAAEDSPREVLRKQDPTSAEEWDRVDKLMTSKQGGKMLKNPATAMESVGL
jgi:hypothetical protein